MKNIVSLRKSIHQPLKKDVSFFSKPSLNLRNVGAIYILASLFQAGWLYVIGSNWQAAKNWTEVPLFGFLFVIVWIAMLWAIVHLLFLGVKMINYSRNSKFVFSQNEYQQRRLQNVIVFLVLGILLDIVLFAILPKITDKSIVILLSVIIGGRTAHANMEAVIHYYKH